MNSFFISSRKFQEELSRQVSDACDQITAEMGAEVHDDLIQKLSIFRLYLDRLEQSVNNPDEASRLIVQMRADFENVINSVRRIARQLMPVNASNSSFAEGITLLCQDMERPGSGNIHVSISGTEKHISLYSKAFIFRIVQELIHNAFKHSSAWHVWVRVGWTAGQVTIEVEDDGTDFHRLPELIKRLRERNNTLKMRSQALGASLSYQSGQNGLLARLEYSVAPDQTLK